MSTIVLLDSGPVGLITNPRGNPATGACVAWTQSLLVRGTIVGLSEIIDYEVRRELLRAGLTGAVQRLDTFQQQFVYYPLTTPVMRRAAAFWAQLRNQGRPGASDDALDIDVILAAQAQVLIENGDIVTVITDNPRHFTTLVPTADWRQYVP